MQNARPATDSECNLTKKNTLQNRTARGVPIFFFFFDILDKHLPKGGNHVGKMSSSYFVWEWYCRFSGFFTRLISFEKSITLDLSILKAMKVVDWPFLMPSDMFRLIFIKFIFRRMFCCLTNLVIYW